MPNEQDTTQFNAFLLRPQLASRFSQSKVNFMVGLDLRYEDAFGQRINDDQSDKQHFSKMEEYAA